MKGRLFILNLKLYSLNLKLLKSICQAYKKYFFAMFKIYAYKIIGKGAKAKKYKEKSKKYSIDLHLAVKSFKEYKKLLPQIKAWVKSKEFRQKYLDTKLPYPPLLNPNLINYESIPAKVAWELNIPLPPNYDFIFLTNGVTGSEAVRRFLNLCRVDCVGQESYVWGKGSGQLVYERVYNMCVTSKLQKSIFLCVDSVCEGLDSKHLLESFSKKVPIFYVARDPISRLKTLINHIYNTSKNSNMTLMRRFNLTCDYRKLFPTFTWLYPDSYSPSLENIRRYIQEIKNNRRTKRIFLTDTALESLHNKISFIHCVDIDDITPTRGYNTFCDLAGKFGFEKPNTKEAFLQNANYTRGMLWLFFDKGVELYAHHKDIQNVFKQKGTGMQNLASLQIGGGITY